MSSKILSGILAIASIAVMFVPGLQPIGILGLKVSSAALLSAGLAIGASLLAPKPKVSSSTTDRLLASFDPNTPRKIWFGTTAGATDIRYHAYTSEQTYYHQILCHASHEAKEISEDWFDSEMAWSDGGGVTSKWSGYLDVTPKLVGTSANTVSIDANWGAAQRLTGCAYTYLRYKLTGNSKKAESPFSASVPTRITVRGKGALLPDIRQPGCSADDQSTWDWFDDDSGNNPALQLLFYLIGWRINGKLAVGRGMPVSRLDLDSFITAANYCDEPVSLAAGGTEPRYRSAGVFSEADDPSLVIGNLCAAMNAVLRDDGGRISVHCLANDLAAPVASFTEADIIEGDDWLQTPPIDEYFSIVRGRYTDPSNTALYQLVEYPEVQIGEDDSRVDTFDLPCVQSASQAQRLAKMRLQRNLYRGVFSAVYNYKAWQVNVGDIVEQSHMPLGFSDKLFRVASHSVGLDGRVEMVLHEEHADIYQWDAEESPAVEAAEPTAYDPLLHPFVQALQDLEALGIVGYLTNEAHTVPASSAGAVSDFSGANSAFVIVQNGTTDISDQFTLSTAPGGNPQDLIVSYDNGADPRTVTITGANTGTGDFGNSAVDTASLTVRATGSGDYTGVVIDKVFSLTKSKAGATGGTGASAKLLYLISDRQIITYDSAGAISPSSQTTTFTIQAQNLSSSTYRISMTTQAGTTINANTYLAAGSGGTLTPSGNNADLTGATTFTMTAANFDTARGATQGVIVTVTHVADSVSDKISVLKAQDGAEGPEGDDGLNNATVELYYRNHTGATPSVPTDTLTYTFATAALSGGSLAGWSQTLGPESDGAFVFKTTATASSNTATDNIVTGDWSTPRLQAQSAVDPNALVLYDPMLYADADQLARAWDTTSGTGTIGTAADANSPGGQVMTIAGARRIIMQAALAYDDGLWQILEVARATSGTPTLHAGVAGRAIDRTVLVNTSGADDDDDQHYHALNGAALGSVMQTYYGYFRGRASSGFSFPSPDPLNPGKMHTDTAFISPLLYAGTGTTAASYVELRRLARVPTWNQGGTAIELQSDSFARQNGASDFAGVVYTNYASARGGVVTAVIPEANSIGEIGFTDESSPAAGVQTKWAIRWNADGNLDLYKNGSLAQADLTTYTAGTKIEVRASIGAATAKWSFFKDDAEIGTPDTTMPGGAIRGKARLGAGDSVRELTATIAGADGEDGEDGQDGVTVSPSAMVFTIAAAANGTVKSGELPKTVTFIVTRGGVDLSEDAGTDYTWSNPAGMTASLGGTNNKVLTITAMSATQTVTGVVTVDVGGTTVAEVQITLVKARDGFGSTPLSDDSLTINNTSSYSGTQGGPITRTCGPGNINIDVFHPYATTGTNSKLAGKIQYRTTPGSGGWTDIGAEEEDAFGASAGEPSVLSFQRSISGPSSAENWEFQYVNRRSSGSSTLTTDGTGDVMTVSGEGT